MDVTPQLIALIDSRIPNQLTPAQGRVGWQPVPVFTNGWSNKGAPYTSAAFLRDGDLVFLRGAITGGSLNAAAFTLPVGFRPLVFGSFATAAATGAGRVDVGSDGTVTPQTSATTTALDGIIFRVR